MTKLRRMKNEVVEIASLIQNYNNQGKLLMGMILVTPGCVKKFVTLSMGGNGCKKPKCDI